MTSQIERIVVARWRRLESGVDNVGGGGEEPKEETDDNDTCNVRTFLILC